MKAGSLSISVPFDMCDKDCPYCISKMTGQGYNDCPGNEKNFFRNLEKAKFIAQQADVVTVIITGKGEPYMDSDTVRSIALVFNEFVVEVQTNGYDLLSMTHDELVPNVSNIDTIAISIDSVDDIERMKVLTARLKRLSKTVRWTINITPDIYRNTVPLEYVNVLNANELDSPDQVSFRRLSIPERPLDTYESIEAQKYIREMDSKWISMFVNSYEKLLEDKAQLIRSLPYDGVKIYYYNGISYTYFHNCIQNNNEDDDIRSLVYYPDGHLSTTWYSSNAGRIF